MSETDTKFDVHFVVYSAGHVEPPCLYGSELPDAATNGTFHNTVSLIEDVPDRTVKFQTSDNIAVCLMVDTLQKEQVTTKRS